MTLRHSDWIKSTKLRPRRGAKSNKKNKGSSWCIFCLHLWGYSVMLLASNGLLLLYLNNVMVLSTHNYIYDWIEDFTRRAFHVRAHNNESSFSMKYKFRHNKKMLSAAYGLTSLRPMRLPFFLFRSWAWFNFQKKTTDKARVFCDLSEWMATWGLMIVWELSTI